jgi:hypothetical protein
MLTPQSRIEAALQRITSGGGDGNFLIASTGEFYVQFAGEAGAAEICMEAVGNAHLEDASKLDAGREAAMSDAGFVLADWGNWVLHRKVTSMGLQELAALSVALLRDVYGADPMTIELTVELGDKWAAENEPLDRALEGGDEDHITEMLKVATLLLPAPNPSESFLGEGEGVVVVMTGISALEAWCPEGEAQYAVPSSELFQWLWKEGVYKVVINPSGPGRTEVDRRWMRRLVEM